MSSATIVEVPSNPDFFEGESPAITQTGKPGKTAKTGKSDKSRKLPDVLSVQRGTIISDGLMSSLVPKPDGSASGHPVRVIRHGIRGINNNPKNGDAANIDRKSVV